MTHAFPFHRFEGSHREIGRQYGEACRDLIHAHRDLALDRLLDEKRGRLNAGAMREILRDRSGEPDCLCRRPDDHPDRDMMTFASIIAQPTEGRMWVAPGPPSEKDDTEHAFTAAPVTT